MYLLVLFLLQFSFAATITQDEEPASDIVESPILSSTPTTTRPATCIQPSSVVALNKKLVFDGQTYPMGTEVYFDENGQAFTFSDDQSETAIPMNISLENFKCDEVTNIPMDPETGELAEYNIPEDFKNVGPGGKATKRKGGKGITYCYRAVKAAVRGRVTLTGESAYMAAPQLERAGFKKITPYKAAPVGSICVFGPGGRPTPSGGHKHGHIGIKGRSGLINPESGFHLGRLFIGCYVK